jgi:predicted  nucleic acid-binding Zn-ribbon protein
MMPAMSPQEQVLVALQDLDLMLKEAEDSQEQFQKLGFDVSGTSELRKARTQLLQQLEPIHLLHYERMSARYGRAVAPVTSDMCLGCFAKIPTSYRSTLYEGKVRMCQSCGRILYFP